MLRCQQDIDPQGTLGVGMDGIMRRSFLSKVQQGKTLWLAVHLVGPVKESLAFSEKRPVRNALSKFTPPLAAPAKTLKSEGIRMKGTALVFQMFGADFECLSPSSRTHRTCQVKKNTKRPSGASTETQTPRITRLCFNSNVLTFAACFCSSWSIFDRRVDS